MFKQTIGIPMDTNCAPLPADLFLHANESDFIQGIVKNIDQTFSSNFRYIDDVPADLFLHANESDFIQGIVKNIAQTFSSNFRYIDDVLSLNNYRFDDYLHLSIT